jgi:hypothetical protein
LIKRSGPVSLNQINKILDHAGSQTPDRLTVEIIEVDGLNPPLSEAFLYPGFCLYKELERDLQHIGDFLRLRPHVYFG